MSHARSLRRSALAAAALASCAGLALGATTSATATSAVADHLGSSNPATTRILVIDQSAAAGGPAHVFTSVAAAARYVADSARPARIHPTTAGATSFDLYSSGSERGYGLHLAGVGTSNNLDRFAMCFLCGNWNDQASSITNGGTPVWLYWDNNRLGAKIVVAPWVQSDLSRWGFDNATSSYYIGSTPPN